MDILLVASKLSFVLDGTKPTVLQPHVARCQWSQCKIDYLLAERLPSVILVSL